MATSAVLRLTAIGTLALAAACRGSAARGHALDARVREAVADSVKRTLIAATDLSKPDVEQRLMSLYPDSGAVISASAGRFTTSRAALASNIHEFWANVGQNMRNPVWEWEQMEVTVLAPDAAVLTATYRIPHHTPRGQPHVVGGAWTAVFQRRPKGWVIVQEHLSDSPAP